MKTNKKNILVAPLNWGLGHATRCIPIIKALENNGFNPIIASDGASLKLLKKEFPHLSALELPSYNIQYSENGKYFKWKLATQIPTIFKAIRKEQKLIEKWIEKYEIEGIISDNRLGVHSKKAPSVYVTHQLTVLTGNTSWISSKVHRHFIKKFVECWIPDFSEKRNLSGELGHLPKSKLNIKHIGPLSRFHKKKAEEIYDLMVLLSGPEPQRSLLEEKLKKELFQFKGTILFIRGIIEDEQKTETSPPFTFYNFMTSDELELAINQSKIVICRSGYTNIMDFAKLGKKAFFIPTPGQYEQEYLAKKMKQEGIFSYVKQADFKAEHLLQTDLYQGIKLMTFPEVCWGGIFSIFE